MDIRQLFALAQFMKIIFGGELFAGGDGDLRDAVEIHPQAARQMEKILEA